MNITQGFREGTLWSMLSKDAADRKSAERNYDEVMGKYGQMPGGMFAADENARQGYGDPRQAAETCSMVEFMHSFEMLARETGTPAWADRCEDVAFNSLPAALTADLRGLHYLTAANGVALTTADKSPGIQNTGNMYAYTPDGEPNRCCQHNHGHGWPYFAESLWMATQDDGLAALLYAPSRVTAKVGDAGDEVTIEQTTAYPFDGLITFKISAKSPVAFPMLLPHARLGRLGDAQDQRRGAENRLQARRLPPSVKRTWNDGDAVELTFPTPIRVKTWDQNKDAVSVYKGPLAFSLEIGRQDPQDVLGEAGRDDRLDRRGGHADDAVELRPGARRRRRGGRRSRSSSSRQSAGDVGDQPFTADAAPLVLEATAKRIANWQTVKGDLADVLQQSPVKTDAPAETVRLIPMGAARLRVSAFPVGRRPAPTPATGRPRRRRRCNSASHTNGGDTLDASTTASSPRAAATSPSPRFTWWPRRGGTEWVIYRTLKRREVGEVSVYWFDDTGRGECRVPAAWRLLYKDGDDWKPVTLDAGSTYGTAKDRFNRVTFAPVIAEEFKIEADLQPTSRRASWSGGSGPLGRLNPTEARRRPF